MAQRTIITLVDDLDGGPADETVTFGIDGNAYEIDLTTKHAQQLRDALADYTKAGRRTRGGNRRQAKPVASRTDLDQIRQWANANGHKVSPRGRIAQAVIEAYDNR